VAKNKAIEILESLKIDLGKTDAERKETLGKVAATTLKTKVHPKVSKVLTDFLKIHIKFTSEFTQAKELLKEILIEKKPSEEWPRLH